jgi:hypothetical protein
MVHGKPTSANNREEDARHLCMWSSLHPDSASALELRALIAPKRDDFFPMDVICHLHWDE